VRQIVVFTGTSLVSVSPTDGQLYWRYPWPTQFEANVATPISIGDYLFISSGYGKGCGLLKVQKDGSGELEVRRVYENNQMCNHFSSSVLYKERLYGFNESVLQCMELRTGKVAWSEKGFRKGSLLIADGHLIILGETGKLALAEATPSGYKEQGSFRVLHSNRTWTVPALAGGRLYVRDEAHIVCIDLASPSL
jgi:outer membrane protein assembly factor BamB